jgi:hypothetical protein
MATEVSVSNVKCNNIQSEQINSQQTAILFDHINCNHVNDGLNNEIFTQYGESKRCRCFSKVLL